MPTIPIQACSDNPSYFSEKCSRCRFACLKDEKTHAGSATAGPGSLSIPGVVAVAAGVAASVAGYPTVSAGLTVFGAAAIVVRIIRK